jgi:uridylate kinase
LRLAIKIGGSIAVGEKGPRQEYISAFLDVVGCLDFEKLVVGIGGGRLARNYLSSTGSLLSPEQRELVVIELLRANTRMLSLLLGGEAVFTEDDIERIGRDSPGRIFVIGGIRPGRSTDANTALMAEAIGADLFVKLTDVDGVFTADPDQDEEAELIERMSFDELRSLSVEGTPGSYGVLDRLAISVLERADIPVQVMNGKDPAILGRLLGGEDLGTLISKT